MFTWISSALMGMLDGHPSMTQPTLRPWLSPQVVTRKAVPKELPAARVTCLRRCVMPSVAVCRIGMSDARTGAQVWRHIAPLPENVSCRAEYRFRLSFPMCAPQCAKLMCASRCRSATACPIGMVFCPGVKVQRDCIFERTHRV